MKIKSALFLFICLFANPLFAYKQDLHMYMTEYAVSNSVINKSDMWSLWGINSTDKFQYRQIENKFHMAADAQLTYAKLFVYGADAEDEGQDISHALKSRAVNHFFNPQANKTIFLPGIDNYTSPDWILEGTGFGLSGEIAGQNYSYSDAQHNFYLAFTSEKESDRNFNMGLMFQSLGHVVHHIQDMAQPEHTRADPHCDAQGCINYYIATGDEEGDDTSLYEEFTAELLACKAITSSPSSTSIINCPNLKSFEGAFRAEKIYIGGYPAPIFTNPRQYWTSPDRKGLADFSSANFISTDRAYQIAPGAGSLEERLRPYSSELSYPDGNRSTTFVYQVNASDVLPGGSGNHKMQFIGLDSLDYNTNEIVKNTRMATFSLFTERYLVNKTPWLKIPRGLFSVNHTNLQQRAKILLPRAVGYTTGLINYFFRYRFIVDPKSDGIFNVKNDSNLNFSGEIHFYYDDQNGNRILITARPASLSPGESMEFNAEGFSYLSNRSSKFYAVAVHKTNIRSKPYAAVAAVKFEYPLYESCNRGSWEQSGNISEDLDLGAEEGFVVMRHSPPQGSESVTITKTNGEELWCTLISRDLVTHFRYYMFHYDPNNFPERKIKVNVRGWGSATWGLTISCPGSLPEWIIKGGRTIKCTDLPH